MAKIARRLSASSSEAKKGHPDGKLFPFSTCAQRHKNMEKGGLRKYLQHTHSKPTTDSNLAVDAFALFCGVFCDFLPITLRAENTSQGGPKEAYQSWLSWNILWHEPSREKGFAPWPVCVPDLGHKLPGFAPQLASAFSSHFPAIITLINLLTAGGPRNCNGSKPVWGMEWKIITWITRTENSCQLPVACVPSRQLNPIPIAIISTWQPGNLSFSAATGRQQS